MIDSFLQEMSRGDNSMQRVIEEAKRALLDSEEPIQLYEPEQIVKAQGNSNPAILEQDQQENSSPVKQESVIHAGTPVVNKSLSLIEEEDEVCTNEDAQSPPLAVARSSSKVLDPLSLVRDIEQMERDFTQFLESLYN